MRDYQGITVRAAALHIVAPRDGRLTITAAQLGSQQLVRTISHRFVGHVGPSRPSDSLSLSGRSTYTKN